MSKYYEVTATIEGTSEILFGSFSRNDCVEEIDAERDSWKDQGYKAIKITTRDTADKPDPEVYAGDDDVTITDDDLQAKIDELQRQKINTGGHGRRARIQQRIDALQAQLDAQQQADDDDDDDEIFFSFIEKEDDEPQVHYFASFALGWATGATRDEAIEKLVNANRTDFKNIVAAQHKEGSPGAYIWTCEVHAPADAEYSIEFYTPTGVEWADSQEHAVTYVTAKQAAWCRTYESEAKLLRRRLDESTNANA